MDDSGRYPHSVPKILEYAQEEAWRLDHAYIGTEHVLLALLRSLQAPARSVMEPFGINLEKARAAVQAVVARGVPPPPAISDLTPRARHAIEQAIELHARLGSPVVSTYEFLVGLLNEPGCRAVTVLEALGAGVDQVEFSLQVHDALGWLPKPGTNELLAGPGLQPARESGPTRDGGDASDERRAQGEFSCFTEAAVQALGATRDAAMRYPPHLIAPEQLLYGLVVARGGIAAQAFRDTGLDLERVRSRVEALVKTTGERHPDPPDGPAEPGLTLRVVWALQHALEQAVCRGHTFLSTGHLLLGLVIESEYTNPGVIERVTGRHGVWNGAGASVLTMVGASGEALRSALEQRMSSVGAS